MKYNYLFISLFYSISILAGNHIAIIGGGGEDRSKSTTMFDTNLDLLGQYYQSTTWQ